MTLPAGGGLAGARRRRAGSMVTLSREVFRAQVGSDAAKRARWYAETVAGPQGLVRHRLPQPLLNEPVANLAGPRSLAHGHPARVLPAGRGAGGVPGRLPARSSRPRARTCSTSRCATSPRTGTSVLAYAPAARVAAVMLFSQRTTRADDEDMAAMTAPADRRRARGRRQLLPAVPAARRARAGRARLPAAGGVRRRASATTTRGCCSATPCGTGTSREAHEPAADHRHRLRRPVRRGHEPQLHPGPDRRPGPHLRPVRAGHLRRRAARGLRAVGGAGGVALDPRDRHLLPVVRHPLLPRRAARPGHRLRVSRPRHRPATACSICRS